MCSRFLENRRASSPVRARVAAFALLIAATLPILAHARDLRVCADPDNLPFSNTKQQGFENRIAELAARDLHVQLQYEWQRMGRGFVRDFLNAGRCDLLIGIQALDEDYTPPATALARRGLQNEIVPFDSTGDEADSIIRAVAKRQVDTAIVWGPLAGFYARKFGNALQLTPVTPQVDPPNLPFTFSISMGVRKGNTALQHELDNFLQRRRSDIRRILDQYGVPQLELAPSAEGGQ